MTARAYANAIETAILRRHGQVDTESELGQWLAWMRGYADRVDPSDREDLARYPDWV